MGSLPHPFFKRHFPVIAQKRVEQFAPYSVAATAVVLGTVVLWRSAHLGREYASETGGPCGPGDRNPGPGRV